MTTQQIVLQGPGPWGFRLVGGKDFEQPLAISRVREAWDARGAGCPRAGARRGSEEARGGRGPAGAVRDGGFGIRGRSWDRREHPGAPGAPCAERSPRASGQPPPAAPSQARRCGASGASGAAAGPRLPSRRERRGSFRSFAPEARPGVWTRFVERRGKEGPHGPRTLVHNTVRCFARLRVAEGRSETPRPSVKRGGAGGKLTGSEWD